MRAGEGRSIDLRPGNRTAPNMEVILGTRPPWARNLSQCRSVRSQHGSKQEEQASMVVGGDDGGVGGGDGGVGGGAVYGTS